MKNFYFWKQKQELWISAKCGIIKFLPKHKNAD